MALEDGTDPPKIDQLADGIWAGLLSLTQLDRLGKMIQGAIVNGLGTLIGGILAGAGWVGVTIVRSIMKGEDQNEAAFGEIAAVAVEDLFGVKASASAMKGRGNRAGRQGVAVDIGDMLLRAFAGQTGSSNGGEITPTDVPAKAFLSSMTQLALEGWLEGWIVEAGSLGQLETFGELDDTISSVLGLGRASAAVHGPLVRHLIVTPLEWKILKEHRPTLLSETLAVREFLRGTYSREELDEELARQGWTDKRIQAHINATAKELPLNDTLQLIRHGRLGRADALATLRAAGYDLETAELVLVAEESRRFDSYNDNPLGAITRAYVNRDISESEFRSFLPAILVDDTDRSAYESGAALERALNTKHLSHGEVLDCVEQEILSRVDYRRWLEREGYPPEDAAALELRLAKRLNAQADIEHERERIAKERAADKIARDQAAAQRRADVEAERALHRRGALGDLERAAVRGLIPLSRVEEVLAAQYDADTIAVLLELVEGDRVAYVDQQQRAADAKQRAGRRNIDVGDIEQAVLTNVLSVDEYRQRLVSMGFDAADAAILTSTLQARKTDLDAARAKRAAADTEAKKRSIDLGRFERLVRRGVRTFADYDALLLSLNFDDGSRAAMADLLRLDIADDEAARKARETPKPPPAPKALSLEQARRAVLLGVLSDDLFQTYLVDAGYTSEAQRVLLAELRRDVVDAEDARRKREAAEAASGVVALPLSRVASAARLSLISPATYQARLERDGYTPDDIAIEMELLLVEIADTQAARARRDELAAAAAAPQTITLQQIERAVKAGTASINDYRFALSQVYQPDDVELLARTLEAELDTLNDARRRRVTIEGELAARTLSIGDLEAAVKAGAVTFEQYRDQLIRWGYGADDAELLTSLLVEKVNAAPAEGDNG